MNNDRVGCGLRRVAIRLLLVVFLSMCPGSFLAAEYRLYWGDTHTHLSDGTGTPDQLLSCARDSAHLDFVILTDHDFGNGPPWRMSQAAWNQIQDKVEQYTVEGKFVAIAGYEWTSQAKYWTDVGPNKPSERLFPGPPKFYNHKNVYFPARVESLFSAKDPAYHTPDLLAEAVRKHGGLIQNNHPFVFGGNETRDQWEYASRHRDVIVNTEIGPDTSRYQGKTYQLNWEQGLREFLNRGGKTGFVRGTDTHEGKPAARTAVLAEALTREAIFEALRNRRNYAVSHARIELDFQINGHRMGEEIVTREKPEIAVSVTGTAPIAEVAIIRDGSVLHRVTPNMLEVKFTFRDDSFQQSSYYYLRAVQSDADEHGNPSRAWSSPIWVKHQRATAETDQRAAANPVAGSLKGYITSIPPESAEDREARHKKIAQRRCGSIVMVHRGAWSLALRVDSRSLEELSRFLAANFPERTNLEGDLPHQQQRARRILERAWVAQQIGQMGDRSARAVQWLEELVAHRTLHHDGAYRGLDGVMAARALGVLGATESVPFLVRTFLAVDPELKAMVKPPANYPYAWADTRLKQEIICALGELPCEESKKFLREYLAMDEATAGKSASPAFEEATRALLRQEVTADEVQCLLRSTNPAVRGTTILVCLDDQTASRDSSLVKIMPWTRELPRAGR
jgi:hypothetical protein